MSRLPHSESMLLDGSSGKIEVLIDFPETISGIAVVSHPHPLYGGSNTNKVTHTIARTYCELGYVAVRPNFRGVGLSEGQHDQGVAELQDMLSVVAWACSRWGELPVALGGFSFGGFVFAELANVLVEQGKPPCQLVLVGTAAGAAAGGVRFYVTPDIPVTIPTLLIHGEEDDTVPLKNVLDWARPQSLPVVVIPGVGHFFHGKLHIINNLMRIYVKPARELQQTN